MSTCSRFGAASKTVTATITGVGTEPFGVAVSGFRSGTIRFYRAAAPYDHLITHQYPHDLSHLSGGDTVLTADSDRDFVADVGEPRAFTMDPGSGGAFCCTAQPVSVSPPAVREPRSYRLRRR